MSAIPRTHKLTVDYPGKIETIRSGKTWIIHSSTFVVGMPIEVREHDKE